MYLLVQDCADTTECRVVLMASLRLRASLVQMDV
jgi:hypothetical protein